MVSLVASGNPSYHACSAGSNRDASEGLAKVQGACISVIPEANNDQKTHPLISCADTAARTSAPFKRRLTALSEAQKQLVLWRPT